MNIELTDLLDAGVHFGHQVKRWNPKSKTFVFDHRQGISIIDLAKTYEGLQKAYDFIEDVVSKGGEVLFVGTKRQAQEIIRETATNTGMPFCANRWMGGTLTNWKTITSSVAKYKKYMQMEADGSLAKLPKKEGSAIRREMDRMHRNFEGIVKMDKLPAAMFVVDVNYEDIAVAEAQRSKIPVAAIVDTNSDPNLVDHAIPGNDDAVKSIRIILEVIAEAVESGRAKRESKQRSAGAKDVANAGAEMVSATSSEAMVEEGGKAAATAEAVQTGVAPAEQAPATEPQPPAPEANTEAPSEATEAKPESAQEKAPEPQEEMPEPAPVSEEKPDTEEAAPGEAEKKSGE